MRKKDIIPKWIGEVINGKLFFVNKDDFYKYVAMNYDNKKVEVTVSEFKKKRSINQNNYYYGVVIPIAADEMGVHPYEAHDILGREFLKYQITDSNGEVHELVRSTTDLTTVEAEEYYRQCREYISANYEAYIPLPNEVDWTGKDGDLTAKYKG